MQGAGPRLGGGPADRRREDRVRRAARIHDLLRRARRRLAGRQGGHRGEPGRLPPGDPGGRRRARAGGRARGRASPRSATTATRCPGATGRWSTATANWCRHERDPRPLEPGRPAGAHPARGAVRGARGHRRGHRTAGLRPVAGGARPRLRLAGRLPRLVGRRARRVHDHRRTGRRPAICRASWSRATGTCGCGCTGSRRRGSTTRWRSTPRPPPPARPVVAEPPRGERPPRRDIPDVDGLRWFAGDFHAHTLHSDGALTIAELAELAQGRGPGLPGRHRPQHRQPPPVAGRRRTAGITLLPGQEVTTDRGHANVFGDVGWVDFRQPADSWVRHAARAGGLISINHPLGGDCAWLQPLTERPRIAEVWHSGWWDRALGRAPGLGRRLATRPRRDRRQRLPPARRRRPARRAHHLGAGRGHRPESVDAVSPRAVPRSPPAPTRRCCSGWATNCSPSTPTASSWCAPTARARSIRGDRVLLPADDGRHRLETYENEVIALCA